MSKGKILVIRGGAIGDFILTLPVLSALRQQFPKSSLEVLGYAHIAQLALVGGLVDAVRSIEARALAGFFARGGNLDAELQQYFAGFAIILSYLYDPDGIFHDNIARCSKAQFIIGPHRPEERAGIHATEVFLRPLERLAIFNPDPVPRLQVGRAVPSTPPVLANSDTFGALGTARPTIALHPGSGSERKNWPEQNWAALMKQILQSFTLDLLLIGGEAEENKIERLADPLPRARYQLARNLPLPELAEKLSACAGFIGHDSGISHLAAALGLPGIVLWGDTAEAVWRPRSEHVTILRDPQGLPAITISNVLEELRQVLASVPEAQHFGNG